MHGSEELSIDELASNLSTYKEQIQQWLVVASMQSLSPPSTVQAFAFVTSASACVLLAWFATMLIIQQGLRLVPDVGFGQWSRVRKLLVDDPGNSEYVDMEKELEEVIALTEELLVTTKQSEITGLDIGASAGVSPGQLHETSQYEMESSNIYETYEKFTVGTKVQAVWSEDGEWYDATIEALTPNGYYVSYNEWGNKEEVNGVAILVDPGNVRQIQEGAVNALLEAEKEAEATKQAIKRKIAQAAVSDFQSRSLPAKLRIEPDDPEDVKAAKRKKIHSFKSKMRFEQLEVTQNKRQNAWQQFQTTKGHSKKIGFFSGRKRESIFKSPDDPKGKVGVTGSGKGLTDFQRREKHLHLKGGGVETED
ncbi:hypothetical protein HHK36_008889 [Tetracentron sinense]|uniref:Survival of motor neuron-related-splicing factor 30 n=1 Tax=Tetracentron sinense TaxID=13715 RepID=A0A835DGY6_TETSI|nr:hypothetical protein HHK36_008889 [Tetracentron sinense]